MKVKPGEVYVGTSGWVYSHWDNIFYPKSLSSSDRLSFFSSQFKTTEVNYSFYHLPKPTTYQKWYKETPKGFIFAVKCSRFITHIKRLKGVKNPWKLFLKNALFLKEKLGPILFQFPPSFKATEENIKRLENFLEFIKGFTFQVSRFKLRFAFEFRDQSFCDQKIYNLLKKHNCAWVIADSSGYPKTEAITADFVYIRMHGPGELFASKYTTKELRGLAKKIKGWQSQGLDIYVYFNNDFSGYALENAKTLRGLSAPLPILPDVEAHPFRGNVPKSHKNFGKSNFGKGTRGQSPKKAP